MDQEASEWKTLLTRANQLVRSATHPAAQLPVEGHLPGFEGATGWLNSPPLTAAELRGRVVLVDFWTYTCINWLRTLPYVRAWADRYTDHGLTVIGVHTPEFGFEHDLDNVRREVRDLRVDYPVAIDSDYRIWTAFDNLYWPALYVVDAQGQIRHHRFGEGDYQMSEMVLQQLLTEAGSGGADQALTSVDASGVEAAADWDSLWSPERPGRRRHPPDLLRDARQLVAGRLLYPPGAGPEDLVFTGPGGGGVVARGTRTMLSRHNFRRTYHSALAKLADPATQLRPTAAEVLKTLRTDDGSIRQ
jgi:thiol-disulfide isomerase/thioredoxin